MVKEIIEFNICKITRNESEKLADSQPPNAASVEDKTNDTIRMKAMETINPNENNRTPR